MNPAPQFQPTRYTPADFATSPLLVFYEVTRACDLVCQHCRACASPFRHRDELTTAQACDLLTELTRFPKPPVIVFTGGDPLKRDDIFDLVRHAVGLQLDTAMSPSATPLLTPDMLARLAQAGLKRIAISLDGADAATHDAFRGVPGTFDRALEMIRVSRSVGLSVQINTTLHRGNLAQIEAMADLLAPLDINLWSVFFLVPTGRATDAQRLSPSQYESAFARLFTQMGKQPYGIKTTEAPFFRRFVLQHGADPLQSHKTGSPHVANRPGHAQATTGEVRHVKPAGASGASPTATDSPFRGPLGVNDGKGVMFISHTGRIYPSGFLPIEAGVFPRDSVVRTYQQAAVFQALRDPQRLKGKCGICEYNDICAGSRARAYALTGDCLAAEPDCAFIPEAWK